MTTTAPEITREEMEFDVLVIGAGPAGLSAAIKLKQLNPEKSVCILEKGSEVGAQIVSGALLDTRALAELFEDFEKRNPPALEPVSSEKVTYLTKAKALSVPLLKLFAPNLDNTHSKIISLGDLCRWLAEQAEGLGIDVFPGFAGKELHIEDGKVTGVITGDMGVGKDGKPGSQFTPGMILKAKQVVLAEGARGSLTKDAIEKFDLLSLDQHQTYGLGIKEVWKIPAENHKPGFVQHTFGWPLDNSTYGGGFIYHYGDNLVSFGFVTGLDYKNPWLSPFEEMQRLKTHPSLKANFEGGTRQMYAARVISEGGLQSLPKLTFPGGVLVGDSAGFLNMARIKGIHAAMKSGMLAAEAINEALENNQDEASSFEERFNKSWLYKELYAIRNVRPAFAKWGNIGGAIYAGIQAFTRGMVPWTLNFHHDDRDTLIPASKAPKIDYPKPDNKLTFDRLSSVFLSQINHQEDQPVHLIVKSKEEWEKSDWEVFHAPETRYCPAGVYEVLEKDGKTTLQISSANCLHCKTCDIKDPDDNITWTPPEGGSGPNYPVGF